MGLLAGTIFDRPPHCDRCELPEAECRCPPEVTTKQFMAPERQTARLSLEKRKKGKLVTIVRGLGASDNDLPALVTKLKNTCGAGGALDGDIIEIQGDQIEKLTKTLSQFGYKVR